MFDDPVTGDLDSFALARVIVRRSLLTLVASTVAAAVAVVFVAPMRMTASPAAIAVSLGVFILMCALAALVLLRVADAPPRMLIVRVAAAIESHRRDRRTVAAVSTRFIAWMTGTCFLVALVLAACVPVD